MPNAAPMPKIADSSPTDTPTCSAGSSSRAMPIDSGKMPPDAPCRTRPRMRMGRLFASAETTVPAASRLRITSKTRRLPNMSPRRPPIGAATADASRYAVSTQLISPEDALRSLAIAGRAGATSDWRTAATRPASASEQNTSTGFAPGVARVLVPLDAPGTVAASTMWLSTLLSQHVFTCAMVAST